ncbi:N-acetyltransferase [Xanthomonas citri pv. malvacearum str. GSPB1386]|nr:GNAT family N-acetyltransferase [Xanthomonas citri]OOW65496.1 acetyltransferase [Xanthomonas campestris pv. thespesiae]OOW77685.1 acetyltransferase [Xanthomonas campestris pv. leeana]AOL18275.1 GNAT family N-acetyltransferase [Xanthomonas citri pv. malvacearum]ASY87451.1 N-acetyltransferase [Xanthomonas citri pv. malvacearum]EKQ62704.1 N-acetyltransferase [Xanthomonas citri pv. malvacearum str. GSPB2388]
MNRPAPQIRSATPADVPLLHELITALAVYEREPDAVKASLEDVRASLFDDGATAHALICEQDGQALGFAVYFFNYSTWLGRNGLYLEDLFVRPEARGKGAGLALLRHLAQLAVQRGCGRLSRARRDVRTTQKKGRFRGSGLQENWRLILPGYGRPLASYGVLIK